MTAGGAVDLALVALAITALERDLSAGTIPNRITFPGLVAGLVLSTLAGAWVGLERGLLGAGAVGLCLWPLWRSGRLGGGDFKIACALASFKGLVFAYSMTFYGALLAALSAVIVRAGRGGDVPLKVPLGACLAIGALWTCAEEHLGHALVDFLLPS